MGDTFIRHIALLGFEKRFVPSQHYVSSGAACQRGRHTTPFSRRPQDLRLRHGLPGRLIVEGRDRGQMVPGLWASVGRSSGCAVGARPRARARQPPRAPARSPSARPGPFPAGSQPSRAGRAPPVAPRPPQLPGSGPPGARAGGGLSVPAAARWVSYVRVVSPPVGCHPTGPKKSATCTWGAGELSAQT